MPPSTLSSLSGPPKPLISAQNIAGAIQRIGAAIEEDFDSTAPLTAICVLKGSFVFAADLIRAIPRDLTVEFLGLRSYGNATETTGEVAITQDLSGPIADQHVLVIEDIIDTGLTLQFLLETLCARNPRSVRVATLLSKAARRRVDVKVDYVGFEIEDEFVVGYGLDAAQRFRNLPYVGTL